MIRGKQLLASVLTVSLVSAFAAPSLRAQEVALDDPEVPVVHKATRPSSIKFSTPERIPDGVVSESIRAELARQLTNKAVSYNNLLAELPPGTGTHDVLPECREGRVEHTPVLVESEELQWFDLLFYNYADPTQAARAEAWERPTAPYLEGDMFNPYARRDKQQELGRVFRVRCLPTRFHFVTLHGSRYLEYREGERAWDRETAGGGG